MPSDLEVQFCKIAIKNGLLDKEQAQMAAAMQKKSPDKKLWAICVEEGWVGADHAKKILGHLKQASSGGGKRPSDKAATEPRKRSGGGGPATSGDGGDPRRLGRIALEEGMIDREQLRNALHAGVEGEKKGNKYRIGECLTMTDALTNDQVGDLLRRQDIRIMFCDACDSRFNVHGAKDGQAVPCLKCTQDLQEDPDYSMLKVGATIDLAPRGSISLEVTCPLCETPFGVRVDEHGERVKCNQCKTIFSARPS